MFTLPIEIEPTETGGYLATSPVLPGFLVEGETIEEVYREAPDVARALLETYRDLGKPIPTELLSDIEEGPAVAMPDSKGFRNARDMARVDL
jgi:predicted RNase H-like HicB family nuclease